MSRLKILIGVLIVSIVLFLFFKDKKQVRDITNEQLQPTERTAIILEPNTGTVKILTPRGGGRDGIRPPIIRGRESLPPTLPGTIVKSIDGARGVRIGIDAGGQVTVTARTKGFIFEPGPAIVISDRPRIGLDVQWLFLRRWGVNSGIVTGKNDDLRAYIAGSYNFYGNSGVLLGVDSNSKFLVGLKVRF